MEYGRPVTEVIGDRLCADDGGLVRGADLHLGAGAADRHLLGDPPVLGRRLRLHLHRLHRPGGAELPAGAARPVLRLHATSTPTSAACSRPNTLDAPWSWAKFGDLLGHLPVPAVVLGMAATAQQIRIMRANLLDEKRKPYVVTARAKGLPEYRVILKYPVRVALNPFASTDRLHPAAARLGQHHRLDRAEPADRRAAAVQGADRPGHVPGRRRSSCCSAC